MANNVLYDPFLNPLKFHALDPVQPDRYVSRFMDDWAFRRTIQPWQQSVCFLQPWLQADSIRLQYVSNYGPITIKIYNEAGQLVDSQVMTTGQQDELRPTYFIRQTNFSLIALEPGKYFATRETPGGITYSEPFEILEAPGSGEISLDDPNPTLLLEYSHYEPYGGIKFATPFSPMLRVPAWLVYRKPGAKDTVYEDQLLDMTMINSVPFDVYAFILGGWKGVPPWIIKKVNRIFGCSDLQIDGRYYTKDSGANFEPNSLENYPMSGWSIELRDKLNRDSVISENDQVIEGIAAAGILIDVKGFGMQNDENGNLYTEINALL